MCFKNLPIEFDAQANATLKKNADGKPFAYAETPLPIDGVVLLAGCSGRDAA